MKLDCPKISCKSINSLKKDGKYFRRNDSKYIQRYRCNICRGRTSSSIMSPCYGQKKRTINHLVEKLYASKVTQRRIALILKIDKKTVHRKIFFLGIQAKKFNQDYRKKLKTKITHLQFDDLITKERTKMLPLSVSTAVCADTRVILGAKVSTIAAFGHLAKLSRAKYGKRKTNHRQKLDELFLEINPFVHPRAQISSDEHKAYPDVVKKYFPNSNYKRFKSKIGCTTGQGELKKQVRDPIFAIDHVFAMFRDNLSRLVRRSWCVTQSKEMLQHHLEIYIKFHNTQLI